MAKVELRTGIHLIKSQKHGPSINNMARLALKKIELIRNMASQ
jgi:hypothetical protein